MPHVAFAPFTGLRVREEELLALGMSLPGLRRRAEALAELPALGLLTLAGMTPDHWSCSYTPVAKVNADALAAVLATNPDLVAISALTASVIEAYAFADKLRAEGVRVVIGGLHATACAEEAMLHADAVVQGEGESVWPQLLLDAEQGQLQPVYRASGRFDLAESPTPRFDLLAGSPPRMTLQTQRGCPFACDFCGASRLLGAYREKPIARITQELHAISSLAPRPWLELADDNTFAHRPDAEALLAALKVSEARYFTEADWRVGERPEVVRRLAASGCVQVLVGMESLTFRYPGMGAKADELKRMVDATEAIQAAGVAVNACFIVGAPGETHESIDRLIEYVLQAPFAEVQITLQTPFPGTALYERLRGRQRLLPNRDWSFYTLFDVTYQPDSLSVAELEEGFRRVLAAAFSAEQSERRSGIRKAILRNRPDKKDETSGAV